MAEYGMIYDANSIKQALRESNRTYEGQQTWKELYSATNVAANKAGIAAQTEYDAGLAAAYTSYLQNRTGLQNSEIVGSGRQSLLENNEAALAQAYNAYRSGLSEQQATIENQRTQQLLNIDEALTSQAENIQQYANLHFDYLSKLYEAYEQGENSIFDRADWSRYLITDEDGNTRLRTREELMAPAYDEYTDEDGNVLRDWTSLYNDKGELTLRGVDFFEQMENQLAQEGAYSFGQFVAETDEDLYNWSQQYNPYDWTEGGSTNKGSFRTMFGIASDDDRYTFAERFGGLSRKQINESYSKFYTTAEEISKITDVGHNADKIIEKVNSAGNDLFELVDSLGLSTDLQDAGFTKDVFNNVMTRLSEAVVSGKDIDDSFIQTVLTSAGAGALSGGIYAFTFTKEANLIPGYGTALNAGATAAGAIIGFFAGLFGGLATAKERKDATTAQNKKLAANAKDQYSQLLNTLTTISMNKRRQAEIDFQQYNKI